MEPTEYVLINPCTTGSSTEYHRVSIYVLSKEVLMLLTHCYR